ncbi:HypC/HybG/HupF family hydrogenase formation chaperone [Yokenella regensburgei]|jgi:hydrogenase expression/formation protein HypC|uniref:HypC/HybG/HupF family hydrogenase formation chaperone n=1 Tax=Yokenella regensburgei TaxID=158877 RepID=UPI0002423114|nr:HypC/HybG/HupF family hydrogenase formation chaperone [Yokenella regensburgei]EHM47560.1 hydrogenase assembly chaperone HypC/HupF [Yokenella regensburgei ATCC 43003]
MCIGIPGKVTAVGRDSLQLATADVGGIAVKINISLIDEDDLQALIGQWVLIHVGFAMSLIDEEAALETLAALENMRTVGNAGAEY